MRSILTAILLLFCAAPVAANEWGSPVPFDNAFVITIDGMPGAWADTMLADMFAGLDARGGAYFPLFRTKLDGVTDPRHGAMLTGYHEPINSMCTNGGGRIAHPSIPELLRVTYALDAGAAVLSTGKSHIVNTCAYSSADGYGSAYAGTWSLTYTGPEYPPCPPWLVYREGPDAVTADAFWDSVTAYEPAFGLLNLSEFDWFKHRPALVCNDTAAFFDSLGAIAGRAGDLVLSLCDSVEYSGVYGGNAVVFVLTDHGVHCDDVGQGYKSHGHTPCGTELCACCDDAWLWIVAPGGSLCGGEYDRAYSAENVAATLKMIFGLPVQAEALPITECFEE